MSTVPIGAWMTVKELQYAEESSYGVLPGSPVFNSVGYEPRVMFRVDPKMLPIYQPGTEDTETIQSAAAREITWDIVYRPTDTGFAKYGVNSQGGGSGTIDKSLTLLMSVKLNAATETWIILNGARPETTSITGRAGANLEIRVIGKGQSFPIPTQTDPGYTYATSSSAQPIQLKDGGLTPLSIDGLPYDVTSITLNVERNLSTIAQPGSHSAMIIIPQNRQITGTFGIAWETLGLLTILGTLAAPTMVWTLSAALGLTLTVNVTQFTKLNSLSFASEDPALIENYAYQASTASLT